MTWIDLRSDTVTQPTKGMRQAMAQAVVGDDVFGDDPTVQALEERMARMLGMEAGVFVASGTMGNLIAVLTHSARGEEILLGDLSHIFQYEAGGCAALGGVHPHIIPNAADGTIDLTALELGVRPDDVHAPRTRLICLENTHNRCGGIALSPEYFQQVVDFTQHHGLSLHLDGARLFNAASALDVPIADLVRGADTVMVCLSKGLGAPIGSVLCGNQDFIREARRTRKIVGGGMRQVGILAAAGLYALDHHVDRLAEDHVHAARLAAGISAIDGLTSPQAESASKAWTNLVYFRIDPEAAGDPSLTGVILAERLHARGVLAIPLGADGMSMRLVTHLGISSADIDVALSALQSAVRGT